MVRGSVGAASIRNPGWGSGLLDGPWTTDIPIKVMVADLIGLAMLRAIGVEMGRRAAGDAAGGFES